MAFTCPVGASKSTEQRDLILERQQQQQKDEEEKQVPPERVISSEELDATKYTGKDYQACLDEENHHYHCNSCRLAQEENEPLSDPCLRDWVVVPPP